ncbi:hypothetical protein ORN12_08590 [Pantoea vagans]|uniref:hypothetical protein n=1 Tax=Pantoea vagans TaxID=470934 RepID=UPI002258088B|nr:hypothetical protein [Pantoea vagans]MCX3309056.1 hypothetical protein [Pantoea vagans]
MKNYLCKWIPPRSDFLTTMSDHEKLLMQQHGNFLNNLCSQGIIIAHGPVIDDNGGYGVSLYQIKEDEDIAYFTSQDPIFKNGVGHYEHYVMLHLASRS